MRIEPRTSCNSLSFVMYLILFVVISTGVNAKEQSIGAIFLNEPVGARPTAMGRAFVGVGEDANTIFWNPAGMVRTRNIELLAVHTEFIQGFRDDYFAFCMPLSSRNAIGINGFISYHTQLEKAVSFYSEIEPFSAYDTYLGLAWSHAFGKKYAAGINLKGLYQLIDTYSAWNVALDLGLLVTGLIPDMNLGLTIKNLGPPIKFIEESHTMPISIELGTSYRLLKKNLLLTGDICKPLQEEFSFKFGAEYSIKKIFFLRTGYTYFQYGHDLGPLAGFTGGIGANIWEYRLDYSFAPFADLGNIHRFSLILPLGKSYGEKIKIVRRVENQLQAQHKRIIKGFIQSAERNLKKGDYKTAIFYYEKILVLNPRNSHFKQKLYNARNLLEQRKADRHYSKGIKAYKKKDYLNALIEWSKVKDIRPSYKQVKLWLKRVNKKLTTAQNGRRPSPPPAPKSPKSYEADRFFTQGLEYLKEGNYLEAINTWKLALSLDPDNSRIKRYLEKTQQQMNEEINELSQQASKSWKSGKAIPAVWAWRKILKINSKNSQALVFLKKHASKMNVLANDLYLQGVQNYVENKLVEAISNWKDVLILDPDNTKAIKHLKRAREKLKEIGDFHPPQS
ncbi:PorV/PorQ family protein [bacterium]|nr:PorV/PorQ family protein [bacterium]